MLALTVRAGDYITIGDDVSNDCGRSTEKTIKKFALVLNSF